MKQYQITVSEEHLHLIADAVEDWHRFLAGQCDMNHATSRLHNYHDVHDALVDNIEPLIAPHGRGSSYGWNGSTCPNKHQKKAIAMSYGIFREILHYFAMQRPVQGWNVYQSETLTCEEQGGLIRIKELENG